MKKKYTYFGDRKAISLLVPFYEGYDDKNRRLPSRDNLYRRPWYKKLLWTVGWRVARLRFVFKDKI